MEPSVIIESSLARLLSLSQAWLGNPELDLSSTQKNYTLLGSTAAIPRLSDEHIICPIGSSMDLIQAFHGDLVDYLH